MARDDEALRRTFYERRKWSFRKRTKENEEAEFIQLNRFTLMFMGVTGIFGAILLFWWFIDGLIS